MVRSELEALECLGKGLTQVPTSLGYTRGSCLCGATTGCHITTTPGSERPSRKLPWLRQ